jgi:lantibiotic modifying enzyme
MGPRARYLDDVAMGLLRGCARHPESGLPLSPENDREMKLFRSPYKGLSGLLYTLALFHRHGRGGDESRRMMLGLIDWLTSQEPTEDTQMTGLFSGETGVAVAVLEAWKSGLIERDRMLDAYFAQVAEADSPCFDVTHGDAGQGLAFLRLARDYDLGFLEAAKTRARRILEAQKPDGGWPDPGDEGGAAPAIPGFAHGVAGVCYFLASYALRTGCAEARAAAERGAAWLWRNRLETDGRSGPETHWGYRAGDPALRNFWCHGALGVGLGLLRVHEATGDAAHRRWACAALDTPVDYNRIDNLGLCHGLAGHGEIMLSARRSLGADRFGARAHRVFRLLNTLSRHRDGVGYTWEATYFEHRQPTMALMVGNAGIAHFLLRRVAGSRAGIDFPFL